MPQDKEISRRRVLGIYTSVLLSSLLAACAETPPKQTETPTEIPDELTQLREANKREFTQISALPLVSREDFFRLMSDTYNSGNPLFQLVTLSQNGLWESKNNPPALPTWVDETATPLVMVHSNNQDLKLVIDATFNDKNEFSIRHPNGNDNKYPFYNSLNFALHHYSRDIMEPQFFTAGMITNVNEWVTWMGMLSAPFVYRRIMKDTGFTFINLETGQPLSEDDEVRATTIFQLEQIVNKSQIGVTSVIFPAVITASQLPQLEKSGAVAVNAPGIEYFREIRKLLETDTHASLHSDILSETDRWVTSKQALPPNELTLTMYSPEAAALVQEIVASNIRIPGLNV